MNLHKAREFAQRFEKMGFKTKVQYDPDFPSATFLFVYTKDNTHEYYQESHAGMKLFYLESWFRSFDRSTFNKIVNLEGSSGNKDTENHC